MRATSHLRGSRPAASIGASRRFKGQRIKSVLSSTRLCRGSPNRVRCRLRSMAPLTATAAGQRRSRKCAIPGCLLSPAQRESLRLRKQLPTRPAARSCSNFLARRSTRNLAAMQIRRLTPSDARAFQASRLRALQDAPSAFGSSYEEEREFSASVIEGRLALRADRGPFGAFVDSELVGLVALRARAMPRPRTRQ